MPIYEYYCRRCNTILSFLSRTLQVRKEPVCPHCKRGPLTKQVSLFAATGRAKEDTGAEGQPPLPMDETKMERAMDALAREAENVSEDDPRQAANLMRKFSAATGMELGAGMKEALTRLEAGEDPDAIEAELGDRLENEDPFALPEKKAGARKRAQAAPRRDTTLYEL